MLRPKGDFWIERYRRQADYERGTFTAKVTAVYSDAVYDVEVGGGLSGGQFYDVNNATGYNFRVGDLVIVARVGGMRGNRHVIIARAGYGGSLPYSPPPAPGGEYDPSASLDEVIEARDSDVYGSLSTLDLRLEAGDGEVEDARQGYASLSDRIAAKADLSSPQFTGAPRAEKYEVHDGAKYVTYDGGGNMTLTDGVTGTKTLSELAVGGGGTTFDALTDTPASKVGSALKIVRVNAAVSALEYVDASTGTAHDILSATHDAQIAHTPDKGDLIRGYDNDTWSWLSALNRDGRALRVVQGWPTWVTDLDSLCEQMLDLVLRNQLDTKPGTAKAYARYLFNDGATANNGIATWSGANWLSAATYRYTSTAGEYYQQYFVGDKVQMWAGNSPGTTGTGAVTIDGAAHGTWTQDEEGSPYLIEGLSYGVHVVRVTRSTDTLRVAAAYFNQWPYQPCGLSGDAVEVMYVPPYICATTIGTSTTNNLAIYPNTADYGETITPRLPCSTSQANDRVVLRDPIGIIGGTVLKPGLVRLPPVEPYTKGWFRPGQTITLGSGGAVRGCRPTAMVASEMAPNPSASIIKVSFVPFIGRITAVAGGSAFAVGELAFGIAVYCSGTSSIYIQTYITANSGCAVDFCKIPAELL